jgi:hypothetical protein
VGDAISIEERLQGLFAGHRQRGRGSHSEAESPREAERRAMERLYGERSKAVVVVQPPPGADKA